MVTAIFKSVARFISLDYLIKVIKPKVVAPFYHLITDQPPVHVKHLYPVITPQQFTRDLDVMLRFLQPVNANDLLKVISGEKVLNKPALFLSFDDGFRESITIIAPILYSKGVPATFFVNPAFVDNTDLMYRCKQSVVVEKVLSLKNTLWFKEKSIEHFGCVFKSKKDFTHQIFGLKFNNQNIVNSLANELDINFDHYLKTHKPYLSLTEIQNLVKMGFTIGGHGVNHSYLADMSLDEQINQVVNSMQWLQQNIPEQPKFFAFPFSDYGLNAEFYHYFIKHNRQICNLMLGTAGYKPTRSSLLLHRIPMEFTNQYASDVLRGEFFYYLAKRLVGKHIASLPYD